MFFSGDPSTRRKVDLGGRSSKERDRNKLLEQARIEREQRRRFRQETQSAIKIQKTFRGRRVVATERQAVRRQFCAVYGEYGEKADRYVFNVHSNYLRQVLFFCRTNEPSDFQRLVGVCRLLHQSLIESGDIVALFGSFCCSLDSSIVEYRVKRLSFLCLEVVHHYRESLKVELLSPAQEWSSATNVAGLLLQTLLTLTDANLYWAGAIIRFLLQSGLYLLLRELVEAVQPEPGHRISGLDSCLENLVVRLALRTVEKGQTDSTSGNWSFVTHILSIPLLFQQFPSLKQVFVSKGLWAFSIHQLAAFLPDLLDQLPAERPSHFPSNVCLLGNLLEVSGSAICQQDCPLQLAVSFVSIARYLMEELPPQYIRSSEAADESASEGNMEEDGSDTATVPEQSLEQQLLYAVDFDFLKHLVGLAFQEDSPTIKGSESMKIFPSDIEASTVNEVCAFLYATISILPSSGVIMGLAYNTQLVSRLWHYMERCQEAQHWPTVKLQWKSNSENHLGADTDGWMLPLSIFCPVYSYMLVSIDNEEFYEQQKPLRLDDLRQLVIVLKEALWQLLWVLPSKFSSGSSLALQKNTPKSSAPHRFFSLQSFQQKVSNVSARLLAELQDWNNRRQFMPPHDFYAREAMEEIFFTQVEHENSRARELLSQAPFLVPFTHRVRIYAAQLITARQQNSPQTPFSRLRVKIRRDRIVEDAFTHLNTLPEEALQGMIRVTFVNELGVEEAGVDGGGIFKDFMENITKAAFDIQYGLFKETADHLLYPNPASHMVHDEHLLYFEFLGKILGKAMFEGILVDIPFATFFLSKLKKKHNYLHDLSSLDPELYRSLLFLKRYDGDLSQLGLYFVIEDNEYGEQIQVELLPGGKDIPVTNENVIRYIHLVANHRLNSQIRQQSYHFLRGFQQLIQTKWIDMFNEHELQVLISGSLEGMNVDDLRSNANYAGGYNEHHPVIEMFWEVVKTLDSTHQQKFLKFVTGCSRGPLLGFKYLEPQFCIQRTAPEGASDDMLDRLPTSATCMNLLKLPPYKRKEVLREKLLYAINADAGFDLS